MDSSTTIHAAIAAVRDHDGPSYANAAWDLYVRSQQATDGLYLTQPEALALCHVTTWPSVRRIFARLQDAGVLTCYHGPNHTLHVVWLLGLPANPLGHHPAQKDQQTARSDEQTARGEHHFTASDRAPADHPTLRERTVPYQTGAICTTGTDAASAGQPQPHATDDNGAPNRLIGANRATSARDPHTVSQFSISTPPSSVGETNHPYSAAATVSYGNANAANANAYDQDTNDQDTYDQDAAPDPELPEFDPQTEFERSFAFLRDPEVSLDSVTAERLARSNRLEYLIQQVFSFRHQLAEGKVHSYGAIITRIDKKLTRLPLTKEDRATPLFRRHAPPWMLTSAEDERRQKYIPPEYADIILG